MSARLLIETFTFLKRPTSIQPTARLVLLAVAEEARERPRGQLAARQARITADEMAVRVGVEPASLTKIYRHLAARGLEVRVPIAPLDGAGRMVFARNGATTTFELPDFDGYRHVERKKRPGNGTAGAGRRARERGVS
ncbi:hypothetical protein M1843_04905 [Isoptericola sp. 4D.3]|uniref:Uncharacterized protein n=1 Tax=Isoptericola peretonis TaxID=2918523 RepID=A0ABT0J0R8_9MICO|nr:hypothetical protein [Isoptericola sp. 4D.3]